MARKKAGVSSRKDRARETRDRICAAAEALVLERGYAATTMAAVARRARVAVQTVYFTFHSKGALFLEVIQRMAHGAQRDTPVLERGWFRELTETNDPQRALGLIVEHGHEIYVQLAPLWNHVVAAAAEDPDFAARIATIIAARRAGMRSGIELLAQRGVLAVPAAQAADTYFLIANPELLSLSTSALGWSVERYKAWTWQQACLLLIDSTPRPAALEGLSFQSAAITPPAGG